MFEAMTETELLEYLSQMESIREKNQSRKKQLFYEVETLEESIERNSFGKHSADNEGMAVCPSFDQDKLYRILKRSYQDIEKEIEDIAEEFFGILEEEEKYRHIQKCLVRLPIVQHEIIDALYIHSFKWENFAKEHCMSRATLGRKRKTAVNNLLQLYNYRFGVEGKNKDDRRKV